MRVHDLDDGHGTDQKKDNGRGFRQLLGELFNDFVGVMRAGK